MIRRRTLAVTATAVAVAVVATVGLGVRRAKSDEPIENLCKKDLAAVFEKCEPEGAWAGCRHVKGEFKEACQAGCVMATCPAQITCTELDPLWCGTSCDDPYGATYWKNLNDADAHCAHIKAWDPWRACMTAYQKERCPAYVWSDSRFYPDDE